MTEIMKLVEERNLPEIPKDREQIKQILQEEIYGFLPPAPDEPAPKPAVTQPRMKSL